MSEETPVLSARGLGKHYGGVIALADGGIDLYAGEVHALVGDNAAGKSTLIKILSGAVVRDSGTITFRGREAHIDSPRSAKALGIETVYQDLALADNLDVPANIFLGRELMRRGPLRFLMDVRRMEEEARRLLGRLKINIPSVRHKVRSMSGGQRQSVAIARSVYFNATVIILDEPTAALGVEETRKVYELIGEMRAQGLAVLMICHNMNHVFENADRITVMKTGRIVGSRKTTETSQEEILRMIVTGSAEPSLSGPEGRSTLRAVT
ncbi:MAG: ATP-binding cassette domain-containing protein [Hyphomicrobiaceae bacterium]